MVTCQNEIQSKNMIWLIKDVTVAKPVKLSIFTRHMCHMFYSGKNNSRSTIHHDFFIPWVHEFRQRYRKAGLLSFLVGYHQF